jgi:hypothetical protein
MSSSEKPQTLTPERISVFARSGFFGIAGQILTGAIIVIVVTVLRWPSISWPHELNVDESQMLSQGMKFLVDPVPWRAVDGTTSGPFNSYLLSLFLLLGFKPGYILVHAIANILVCLHVLVAYQTLKRISSSTAAMWGVLPIVVYLGFTDDPNYLHYSSELLPALLLAAGFYFIVAWIQEQRGHHSARALMQLILCGLALGITPWCKLQALPIAGAMILVVSVQIFLSRDRSFLVPLDFFLFWFGALLPSGLMFTVLVKAGVVRDFWNSYIMSNLGYAGYFNWWTLVRHIQWALWSPEMRPLSIAVFVATLTLLWLSRTPRGLGYPAINFWPVCSATVFFVTSLFAVCRPATAFPHYTIFLLHPMIYLAVPLLSRIPPLLLANRSEIQVQKIRDVLTGGAVIIFAMYAIAWIFETRDIPYGKMGASEQIASTIQEMKQTRNIKSLAIWGWEPGVYVLTGTPPATRDAVPYFAISDGPLQPYFQRRFLGDLRKGNPDLFVDTVAQGAFMWYWSERDGYESDPELKSFIEQNYVLVRELHLRPGAKPVRFFVRR